VSEQRKNIFNLGSFWKAHFPVETALKERAPDGAVNITKPLCT